MERFGYVSQRDSDWLSPDTCYFTSQSPAGKDLLKMALALRAFLLSLSLFISPLYGQLPKKEKYYAVKEDVPHIRCETCQKAVKYLYGKTHDMRTERAAKRVSLHATYSS